MSHIPWEWSKPKNVSGILKESAESKPGVYGDISAFSGIPPRFFWTSLGCGLCTVTGNGMDEGYIPEFIENNLWVE